MKKILLVGAAFLVAACEAPTPVGVDGETPAVALSSVEQILICHYDEDDARYFPLSVALQAESAHRGHGDGQVGDPVPGMEGYEFDENCQPVTSERIFAIAFTDMDPSDGPGFKNGLDVLVAKFVDFNRDGIPNSGDQVITDRYPRTFSPSGVSDFGSFGVGASQVTGVSPYFSYSNGFRISTDTGPIVIGETGGAELINWSGAPGSAIIVDRLVDLEEDAIRIHLSSSAFMLFASLPTDDYFLDVEIYPFDP